MTIAQQLKVTSSPFTIKNDSGNTIYSEGSNGYWLKREYDDKDNEIYYENPSGIISDNRPVTELTLDEIANKFNISVNQLKIKK